MVTWFLVPSRPLKTYIIVNFRACEINQGARKLAPTLMLIKTKKELCAYCFSYIVFIRVMITIFLFFFIILYCFLLCDFLFYFYFYLEYIKNTSKLQLQHHQ
jgi:hypothetical protein